MIKIGITGGIGSGKSTVCDIWQSLGAYVINADNLAKTIMIHNPAVKRAIIEAFGKGSYQPDGSLNKAYLANEAFEKGRVEELNAIVHPHIPKETEVLMESARKRGIEAVVYEAALLLQNVRPDHLDYIVLVLSEQDLRVKRVQDRDEVDRSLVMDRINKQQNFEELKPQADIIIRNNGSLDELKIEARKIYKQFVA